MSNISSNNYYGGSTIFEVTPGGFMPAHLSGASPTTYYCNNLIWQQLASKKSLTELTAKNNNGFVPALNTGFNEPKKVGTVAMVNARQSSNQYTPLHVLSCQGNLEMTSQHLEQCAISEINRPDHNGNTPLIWAAVQGHEDLVSLLIDNHANVNAQNFNGETALLLCSSFGHDNIVALLLENGANPNIANVDGATPVHLAAANGNVSTVALLASFGAFVNCQDNEGDTPLHYAVREGHSTVVEQLVTRCNACVDTPNEDEETVLELASLLGMDDYVQFLSHFSAKGFAFSPAQN